MKFTRDDYTNQFPDRPAGGGQKGEYKELPEGEYAGEIAKAVHVYSKSGTAMVNVGLKTPAGWAFDTFCYNHQAGLARLHDLREAVGLVDLDIPDDIGTKDDPVHILDLIGRELAFKYKPETKTKIFYIPASDSSDVPF